MNTTTPAKKEAIMKSLAILGFIALIGLIAWTSVQIVSYAPRAFSSLASIAASLNDYKSNLSSLDESLTVSSDLTSTEEGRPVTISWEKDPREGSYAFSYQCTDGVAVDVLDAEGLRSIACDTNYDLGDTDNVTVIIDSEKQKETSLAYNISFIRKDETGISRQGGQSITVTNPEITDQTLGMDDSTNWQDEVVDTTNPNPTTPTPEPAPQTPVSNTSGFVDLATRFINTGKISNNAFVAGTIKQNTDGAFQFEVINQGTKTSELWNYSVILPDDYTYTSPNQTPLKPGERATITLGFPVDTETSHNFIVTVKTASDIGTTNNNFTKIVKFVK